MIRLKALWREAWQKDVEAHRQHLDLMRADPATSLKGHRIFAVLVFALGIVVGFGAAIGVAW
jgi:hypothetical protein